ncbi:hypothetical protein EPN95_00560 [Patescibacteria group bacterium]|nr:MAG: hypothetical protein EPN95_00560 [Patescibacteria group bacterium]
MDQANEFEQTQPDELTVLATAIASREQKELAHGRLLIGAAVEPEDPGMEHDRLVNGVIRNLLRTQNPDSQGYLLQMLDAELKPMYKSVAKKEFERTGKRISIEEAKEKVLNHAMDMMSSVGQDEEQSSRDFKDLLQGAQIVAAEHEVSLAAVYDTDELFEEAHRAAYRIDEFAMRFVDMLAGSTVQSMTQLTLRAIPKKDIPVGMDESEYFKTVSLGADFRSKVVDAVLKKRAAIQTFARTYLERIWGEDAVSALPDEIKRKLGI